ncbi:MULTISPECIES: SMI1/KNR4 family protein [unclassified Streptomyces]|uniref:SMI1/KNR4 family protein n=1 Tax=Streptomyces sp. NBC_00060 TaxID=2975636 RepID=A0AAU2GTP9_9ACTN
MRRYEWRPFLERWSAEWADVYDEDLDARDGDRDAHAARWLGFEPADEERLAALERRTGHPLPPSLRSFLQVTDGWRYAGHFVYLLAGTEHIDWCGDPHGLGEIWLEDLDEDADDEEVREAGVWARSLQLAVESDMVDVLLDPDDVDEHGEWAVYTYASWRAAPPRRYASFRHFMEDMYQEFLRMSADRPGFANDTTRSVDAGVERALADALSGEYEAAAEVLAEAVACGRPRAGRLLAQIRALSGAGDSTERVGASLRDPYVAREAMPLSCAEEGGSGRDDDTWFLGRYPEEDRETVAGVLERIRQGTFAYEASGAFGEAVRVARELAVRARPEAAWRTLLEAAPSWVPLTSDHIAPVGLLADSVLGPLLTPERGRALLATPRGAAATPAQTMAAETAAPDTDGLGWLAAPGHTWRGCRLVLVEGVQPDELHRRMGAGGPLLPALRAWNADTRHCSPDAQTWESRVVVRTGCAGADWTFAYSGAGLDARADRFVSPAVAASHGTRALTLAIDHGFAHRDGEGRAESFHFSLAEDGKVVHSLTVHGDEVTVTGEVPVFLEPCLRLFGTDPSGPEDEPAPDPVRQTLDAIAAAFGVTLSEEALVDGRLDAFETVSWLREPRAGESWAYITMGRPPE